MSKELNVHEQEVIPNALTENVKINNEKSNIPYVEKEEIETSGGFAKFFAILKTTVGLVSLLIIIFGFNLTFVILLTINIYDDSLNYEEMGCKALVKWDTGIFIVLIILMTTNALNLLIVLFRKSNEDSGFQKFLSLLFNLSALAGLTLFIGVQVVYFKLKKDQCGTLGKISLAYIITTYSVLGLAIIIPCIILCCMCCCGAFSH